MFAQSHWPILGSARCASSSACACKAGCQSAGSCVHWTEGVYHIEQPKLDAVRNERLELEHEGLLR